MIELLVHAFEKVGLELNAAKSKILTNDNITYSFLDIANDLVDVVEANCHHKYLGRYLSGEFVFREVTEINHRIQCAWHKFGQHAHILCNRDISIHLRMRLFDSIITPTVLFGIAVLPLSATSLIKIEVLQRKMLRKIVGWVRVQDEEWETTMRRMKGRVDDALLKYPMQMWKERIAKYLWNFILRVKSAPFDEWISQSSKWFPNECEDESSEFVAYRVRGRPYSKWDDVVTKFYREHYQKSWQNMPLDIFRTSSKKFINYFCGYEVPDRVPIVARVRNRPIVRRVVPHNVGSVPFFQPSNDNWW
jgi:hypothetical protein